jgi:hypothetical protein
MDSDLGHFLKGSGLAVLSTTDSTDDDHPRRSKVEGLGSGAEGNRKGSFFSLPNKKECP